VVYFWDNGAVRFHDVFYDRVGGGEACKWRLTDVEWV